MKDLKTPWELFGVECGEGWFSLIEPILQYIQSYNKVGVVFLFLG